MRMNLQLFGGRGSAGGNAKASAESRANTTTKLTADERNDRQSSVGKTVRRSSTGLQVNSTNDLRTMGAGTILHTETGTQIIKQQNGDFTQTTKNGRTLSGLTAEELYKKLKSGKIKVTKTTKTTRRDYFGNYV